MEQTRRNDDDRRTEPEARWVVVTVVRSGGIAGLRRQWRAEPRGDDAEKLLRLVRRCPWDAASPPARGADRFSWAITARWRQDHRADEDEHEIRLADTQVHGPWRALVDEVQHWKPADPAD